MSCENCREQLLDLLLGELEPTTADRISAHVGACPECAVAYARLHLDLAGLAPACEAEPSERARLRLRNRVERAFASPRARALSWLRRPVPAYGLLAAALVPLAVWSALAIGTPNDARPAAPTSRTSTEREPAPMPGWDASVRPIDPRLL